MARIAVVSTGGTIASRWQGTGYRAEAGSRDVLSAARMPLGVTTESVDLFTINSSRLTTTDQLTLLHTVHQVLADQQVDGVVVTHGTDTLEESAFLLDLYQHDPRPVVFTGAQRPLDDEDGDAADNLHDALLTASTVRNLGVLVAFDGLVHAARGTVKTQTVDRGAFADPSQPRIGDIAYGRVLVQRRPDRPIVLDLPATTSAPRVDLIMHHCDADPVLLRAAISAGAQGIVLVGTGAGNATPEIADAVAEAVRDGVLVALTTRVSAGPITPIYTGGGAVDLIAAGAVPTGTLRAAQSRIAVLAAVLSSTDAATRTATLHRILGHDPATALAKPPTPRLRNAV